MWLSLSNPVWLEPELAGFRNSHPAGSRAGSGFGDNSFTGSRSNTPDETNGVNNAVSCYKESTMLSAAIKRQYSSVLPLLRHCLPVFDEICGMATNFVFFRPSNTN